MKAVTRVGAALRATWADICPILRMGSVPVMLVTGSWALARRGCAWCMKARERDERLYRGFGLLVAVLTLGRAAVTVPLLMGPITVMWGAAALLYAPPRPPAREPVDAAEPEPEEPAEEAADAPSAMVDPTASTEAFLALLRTQIGDRNGVLLRDLVTGLREAGAPAPWGMTETRALCTAAGVPVRRSLKTPSGTSPGVHRDDLPAVLGPSPAAPPMGAPPAGSSVGSPALTCNNYPTTTPDYPPATDPTTPVLRPAVG
ncbi:hypothetical protein AB0K71_05820 [Streptomyces syringium]|uniref:hypothetical protein n=1 Tax=Streptomyces syringium TaxID=76729 RepID=UPI0034158138